MKFKFENPSFGIERSGLSGGKKVLVCAPTHFLPPIRETLEKSYDVTYAYRQNYEDILEVIADQDAFIVDPGANYPIDKKMLDRAERLKIIVTPSTGTDHVDKKHCKERNIEFDSLKGKEEIIKEIHASAEFSFTLLLSMVRKLPDALRAVEQGHWREIEDDLRGNELFGKKMGIVGYGRIGKKMAGYAAPFGIDVGVFDPFVEIPSEMKTFKSLDELLKWADILSIHVHLDESTEKMIGARELSLMKKGSYLLNTARGAIVDEDALLEALESGVLKSAALDVVTGEQGKMLSDHKIVRYSMDNDNLILSPHVAGLAYEAQLKAAQFAVNRLNEFNL